MSLLVSLHIWALLFHSFHPYICKVGIWILVWLDTLLRGLAFEALWVYLFIVVVDYKSSSCTFLFFASICVDGIFRVPQVFFPPFRLSRLTLYVFSQTLVLQVSVIGYLFCIHL